MGTRIETWCVGVGVGFGGVRVGDAGEQLELGGPEISEPDKSIGIYNSKQEPEEQ